jgi:hypothetical protein
MDASIKINYFAPVLRVKYKNFWYNFYSQKDYDNWLKNITDKDNISETLYYKGLGFHTINTSKL